MASNSKNIAELLNGDTTLTATDIANDAVTADKLANSINTDIATGVAALPKSGGAMTGAITSNNTISDVGGNVRSGRKNLIINGGFDVSQRKDVDSAAISVSSNTYDIDRFLASIVGVTATHQRLSDQSVNGKIVKTMKQIATSSATGRLGQIQKFELQPKGETVTLSVWVKSNTGNAILFLYDGASLFSSNSHTGGGGWEQLKVTTTLGATKAPIEALLRVSTTGNGNIAITSGDYIESAMWQLELGSVATDFEHRSYGEELALCQRYYYKDIFNVSILPWASSGGGFGGQTFLHNPEMRAAPTITQLAVPSYSNILGGAGPQSQNTYSTSVNVNTSGNEKSFKLQNNVSGNTIYAVSSQLAFSAEL